VSLRVLRGKNSSSSLLDFPVVIKPVDNMGSRGCRRVDCIEDFEEAAKAAIKFSRSGRAIVEAFMDGPEFSVDAIVYHGEITICGLADRHIYFPPYFIEMGHTMPTVIEKEKQEMLLETFNAGVHALGLADKGNIGAAKGDMKFTQQGVMIGEIAARLSGGYMSGWTYPYSSGILPIKAAILAAMGQKPEGLVPVKKWTCAERAIISIPGTVKEILMRDEKAKIRTKLPEFVNDFFMLKKEGDKVTFPENNVTKCGNILASASDRQTAINTAESAARDVLIRLDPADKKTKEFLNKSSHRGTKARRNPSGKSNYLFPPNAFELTYELKRALEQIKEYDNKSSVPLRLCENSSPMIFPFTALVNSGLRDYMGRTVSEVLEAVRLLTGFSLPEAKKNAENRIILGRSFWAALIRGSYQGAVYYIDTLGEKWIRRIHHGGHGVSRSF